MPTKKEKYISFCEANIKADNVALGNCIIPLFVQPWWLDAVCVKSNWDVILYEKDGEVLAALPYLLRVKYGSKFVIQPQFTQNMGVVIKYPPDLSHSKKLSYEKEVMIALIEQLEALNLTYYEQCFNFRYTNWLPFYWKGYTQTTRYTYRIDDISDVDAIIERFSSSKKRNLHKALKSKFILYDNLNIEEFYNYHKSVVEDRKDKLSYSKSFLLDFWAAVENNNAGSIYAIKDGNGNIHALMLVAWEDTTAYNLATALPSKYKNSGATTLLVVEVLKKLKEKGIKAFDFEGSMQESIEDSFRSLGSTQTPYFKIRKLYTKNPLLRFILKQKFDI